MQAHQLTHDERQLEIRMAANVAWHIRTNGMERVTPDNIQLMCRVLERLADREEYVQVLLQTLAALPNRTRDSKAMAGAVQAAELVRTSG